MKLFILSTILFLNLFASSIEKGNKKIIYPSSSWTVSRPADERMDTAVLRQMETEVKKTHPSIKGILITRNGKIVYEKYSDGFVADSMYNIWSLTKSVISTLVGVALQRKDIDSLNQKAYTFLPPGMIEHIHPACKDIKLSDLMNMTSGLAWYKTGTNQHMDRYEELDKIFACAPTSKPGATFAYDGANSHTMSMVLKKATGVYTDEYAEKRLFKPLGIKNYHWEKDKSGYPLGSEGLYLSARDVARIGYLYLRGGKWGSKQVIPSDFVTQATSVRNSGGDPGNDPYGYFWWISKTTPQTTFYGLGTGGHVLAVTPSLGLVTVIVVDPNHPQADLNRPKQLLYNYILPAAK